MVKQKTQKLLARELTYLMPAFGTEIAKACAKTPDGANYTADVIAELVKSGVHEKRPFSLKVKPKSDKTVDGRIAYFKWWLGEFYGRAGMLFEDGENLLGVRATPHLYGDPLRPFIQASFGGEVRVHWIVPQHWTRKVKYEQAIEALCYILPQWTEFIIAECGKRAHKNGGVKNLDEILFDGLRSRGVRVSELHDLSDLAGQEELCKVILQNVAKFDHNPGSGGVLIRFTHDDQYREIYSLPGPVSRYTPGAQSPYGGDESGWPKQLERVIEYMLKVKPKNKTYTRELYVIQD